MRKAEQSSPKFVLYLAVIPFYRQHCVNALRESLGASVALYAGVRHIDPTVSTGINPEQYSRVRNHFVLGRRLLVQTGHWREVLRAKTAILDLNPRSLTVWILTVGRRMLRRRTLHWGHLHPRRGADSRTSALRRCLRRLSHGTVVYGYDSVRAAENEIPRLSVWVAPNSLYPRDLLGTVAQGQRSDVLYVGRLVTDKKVDLLIRGFARSAVPQQGGRLVIVGVGDQREKLERLARDLECAQHVCFTGAITDPSDLRRRYARAFCSVSPGYAGLSLTQSLGFGVPVLVADDEPHAPEIELARFGGVSFFSSDESDELADALDQAWPGRAAIPHEKLAEPIQRYYSAEVMANGLADALKGNVDKTRDDRWPS